MSDQSETWFERDRIPGPLRVSRREFLGRTCACAAMAALASAGLPAVIRGEAETPWSQDEREVLGIREASWWEKLDQKRVACKLCPRECNVDDYERGYCGVRENRGGTYYTLVYGRPCSLHVDPIEKKPLFHFLPGSQAYSLATAGCNMECQFCQNWQISQTRPEDLQSIDLQPARVAREAKQSGAPVLAYTYSEPVVFGEFVRDTAVEGHKLGIRSVMISNGYIQAEPMRDLCGVLDAVKIDLKAYRDGFYRDVCDATLEPVLSTLQVLKDQGIWFEIVYLVVPTLNDDMDQIREMCEWIRDRLGPAVPLHFSRFHPTYKIQNLPPTPVTTLEKARRVAIFAGLQFVYIGNVVGHEGESTYCPSCGRRVIHRIGYQIQENLLEGSRCPCGTVIPGVWS
jgi:pyruvate formate lyase activating enzyme